MKRNALCWKQTHSGAAVSLAGLECFFADCRFPGTAFIGRPVSGYRIPSRHMTRRTKRRTPRGSASHLRDRRFQRRADDASRRQDDSRHHGDDILAEAMLRRAVITVPGQGETECPRGGIPLCGVFRGCRRGRGIPCGWCAYGTVSFAADACFDPDDAVQDMAPFAAKQDDVARPQGADAARRRSRMAGAAGGCVQVGCRAGGVAGKSGLAGGAGIAVGGAGFGDGIRRCPGCRDRCRGIFRNRGQYGDVPFVAQQRPHTVPFHADLDFVSFGEHRFDLFEEEAVGQQHQRRVFGASSPNTVRQERRAAAASGRHSRW